MKKVKFQKKYQIGGKGMKPTTQDSLDLYNNTREVLNWYKNNPDYVGTPGGLVNKEGLPAFQNTERKFKEQQEKYPQFSKDFRENIDQNKFKQTPYSGYKFTGQMDKNVPKVLYDKRIAPDSFIAFNKIGSTNKDAGSIDDFDTYDLSKIKPYGMLTPEEKIERNKLNSPNKTPVSPKDSTKTNSREHFWRNGKKTGVAKTKFQKPGSSWWSKILPF